MTASTRPTPRRRVPWSRVALLVALFAVAGCSSVFETTAPITFETDHRISIQSPEGEETVSVPFTVEWTAGDFEATDGRRFAVFLDKTPLGLVDPLRMRICTEKEQEPIVAGEARQPCHDDRDQIFLTTETSLTFECMDPVRGAPDRVAQRHQISVIFLDENFERIGPAADSRFFRVEENDALRKCRGLA